MQSIVRVSKSRFCRVLAAAFVLAWALPFTASAASPEIFTDSIRGVAINGYDPVAYFTERKPVAGKADIAWSWKRATWRFSTAQNRDAFQASPEKYAPQ